MTEVMKSGHKRRCCIAQNWLAPRLNTSTRLTGGTLSTGFGALLSAHRRGRRNRLQGVHRFRQRSRGATQWQQSQSARPKPTTGSRPRSRPLFFPVLSNYPRQPSSHCYHRLRKVRRLLQRCVRRHLFYSRLNHPIRLLTPNRALTTYADASRRLANTRV